MRVDEIGAGIEVHIPHFVVQLGARDDLSSTQHEMFEKPELHRSELDLGVAARDAARETIEAELTDDELLTFP